MSDAYVKEKLDKDGAIDKYDSLGSKHPYGDRLITDS